MVFWESKEKREGREKTNKISERGISVLRATHMGRVVLGFLLFFSLGKQTGFWDRVE